MTAGPVAVGAPHALWYSYLDRSDIDENVASHLKRGQVDTPLLLAPDNGR